MARYRRYTKTIVRAPRKRWNVVNDNYHSESTQYGGSFSYVGTMVYNSDDNAQPTPVILKCKNATIYGSLSIRNNQAAGDQNPLFVMSYVVYVPEIVYTTIEDLASATDLFPFCEKLLDDHPEWIMSAKNVNLQYNGEVGERATVRWTQTTRKMKRNLKSGDRLMMFIMVRFIGTATLFAEMYCESKVNTCAN